MTALTRLAGAAYDRLSPIARRWLPASIKRRLGGLVGRVENALAQAKAETRDAPSIPLRDATPLLAPEQFADGPVVLVNNALAWGGAERQVVNTLRGLDQKLARPVGLICQKLGEGADYDFHVGTLANFRGFARNMVGLEEAQEALNQRIGSELARAEATFAWLPSDVRERIKRLLADFITLRPRVVHAWQDALSIEAGFAAKLAGVPRIIVSARNVAPIHFAYHRPYMQRAYRELAACVDIVMLNNSEAGARDYAAWLGLAPERFRVLRNGIDLAPLGAASREELRSSLGISGDAPIIGSIFRFYDEKQPLLWIETAALVAQARPDAHFVVYGTGPLLKEARALATRNGFEQRFHTPGALPGAASQLGAFDVFLLTSKFEGTPNVVLEASAAGVPVVATAAGGTVEAIEGGVTGFFVDAPTPEQLSQRVLEILADPGFRARCATAGPELVERRFGLERMIDETLALYGLNDP